MEVSEPITSTSTFVGAHVASAIDFDHLVEEAVREHHREVQSLRAELARLRCPERIYSESTPGDSLNPNGPGSSLKVSSQELDRLRCTDEPKIQEKPFANKGTSSLHACELLLFSRGQYKPEDLPPEDRLESNAESTEEEDDKGLIDRPSTRTAQSQKTSHTLRQQNAWLFKRVSRDLAMQASGLLNRVEYFARARGWVRDDVPYSRGKLLVGSRWFRPLSYRVRAFTKNQIFDTVCAVAIVVNAALLGAMTSQQALLRQRKNPAYVLSDLLFTSWFSVELLLRWMSDGLCGFVCASETASWNRFDVVVVGTDITETWVAFADHGKSSVNLTTLRMLRVLRIARALRIVRLIRFCKELRTMVLSVLNSGVSFLWAMVLLFITIYVTSIYLMQAVTLRLDDGLEGELAKHEESLRRFFGSIDRSMYSLFLSVSSGISWVEIADPLFDLHWSHGLVLCFFIFFTMFALLNIITGIFVQTAIKSVQSDEEEVIQEEMSSHNSVMKQLQSIFEAADVGGIGRINFEQFETLMSDDRTHALMASLGLQLNEARGIFSLLDLDDQGEVSVQEFLVGCMRMRGGAKAVDLVSLMYENKRMMESWSQHERYFESEMVALKSMMSSVEKEVRSVMARVANLQWSIPLSEPLPRSSPRKPNRVSI